MIDDTKLERLKKYKSKFKMLGIELPILESDLISNYIVQRKSFRTKSNETYDKYTLFIEGPVEDAYIIHDALNDIVTDYVVDTSFYGHKKESPYLDIEIKTLGNYLTYIQVDFPVRISDNIRLTFDIPNNNLETLQRGLERVAFDTIDMRGINTSKTYNANYLFRGSKAREIIMQGMDFHSLKEAMGMFDSCDRLQVLNIRDIEEKAQRMIYREAKSSIFNDEFKILL